MPEVGVATPDVGVGMPCTTFMLVVLPSQKSYAFRTNISIFFTVFFKDMLSNEIWETYIEVSLYFKRYILFYIFLFHTQTMI